MSKLFKAIGRTAGVLGAAALTGAAAQRVCALLDKRKLKDAYGWKIEVQGRRMCVKVSGSGKETVVLLPGAGEASPAMVYQPLAELLGAHYTTVTVEYFGYGLSDPAPSPRTVENVAEELHELLHKLGLGKYILAAHSYSGIIAMEYLSRYGEEVSALVGIDMTVPKLIDYADISGINLRMEKSVRRLKSVGLLRLVSKIKPDWITAPIDPERYSQEEMELYRRLCLNNGDTDDMLQELLLADDALTQRRDEKLPGALPVLQFLSTDSAEMLEDFGGEADTWYELHEELTENPHSEAVILEGGHYLQCTHPEEIAEKFHTWYGAVGR